MIHKDLKRFLRSATASKEMLEAGLVLLGASACLVMVGAGCVASCCWLLLALGCCLTADVGCYILNL